MEPCRHEVLTLVSIKDNKLRCRHCHLTITEEELAGGCCPECLAVYKERRSDFEKVMTEDSGATRYCCERCGIVIDC